MATGNNPLLPKLSPIAIKERISLVFVEKGNLDVLDGAFVVVDVTGVRTHIPVGGVSCLMLEPGTRVSHAAATLAARVGCLLCWVGEAGVRLYSSGQPGGARADRLLYQAKLALDDDARLKVVRIEWKHRNYDVEKWESGDLPNRCLSSATACLYGITEAAVLAAGYAPAIGFIHTGKPLSFVYDIADLFKFETVVPVAFKVAAEKPQNPEQAVRYACRESFRATRLLSRIIPSIEEVLAAGGLPLPAAWEDAIAPAIPVKEGIGDVGHRS
jgi:CRISPR-associated protein Cas1